MNISTKLAQTIVSDMKEIVNQEINYINTDGVIIASTDLSRIGTFHGGGKRVVDTRKDIMIQEDGQYAGARKGINLPVNFENSIVGVIGITGENEEIEKYGRIIKRFTELLIKDAYLNQLKSQEKENQRMIIEELLFYNDSADEQGILNKLRVFNLRPYVKRIVVISEILGDENILIEENDRIFKLYSNRLSGHAENLLMQNKNKIIMVLQNDSQQSLETMLNDISHELEQKFGFLVKSGIGTTEEELFKMKASYEKALIALDWALFSEEQNIKYYDRLDLEIILENITEDAAAQFFQKVIVNLEEKDVHEYNAILKLFEKHNGSINKISEALYIHKNTLQYKLNRLKTLTGYDMRKYCDFTVLKLAFLLNSKLLP